MIYSLRSYEYQKIVIFRTFYKILLSNSRVGEGSDLSIPLELVCMNILLILIIEGQKNSKFVLATPPTLFVLYMSLFAHIFM